jgi:alkylation response protein AidB-like acyl-CoA dehydrogenase
MGPNPAFVEPKGFVSGTYTMLTRRNATTLTIYTIFEGTSEIQRLVIARAISGVHIR